MHTLEQLQNYKEILIKRTPETQTFYFELKHLSGFYVLDGDKTKRLSLCTFGDKTARAGAEIRYFATNEGKQQGFVRLGDCDNGLNNSDDRELLMRLIHSNTRQGTPRKFIYTDKKERVAIEFEISHPKTWELTKGE